MESGNDKWYFINDASELDSPALVIYPARVRENIRQLIKMIDDPLRLRPHVKTSKSKEAVDLLLEAGISKFKCATIAEAEMLGMAGATDVLLAYQPLGPKLNRLVELIRQYPRTKYAALVDHPDAAIKMADAFASHDLDVEIYLDLNVGMNRTGIEPANPALALYLKCAALKGLKPVGLHVYDGHIRQSDLNLREAECNKAFSRVEQLKQQIINQQLPEPIIIAGGSPTFPIHAKRKKVECSPGTFIYWDKGYSETCAEQPFQLAALVVSRVISLVDATKLCLDLGHKSIAAENNIDRRVYFLNAPQLKAISQSEEHLVVEASEGHNFQIGDVLYGVPVHICPTVALYERAFIVDDHQVSGDWATIARDRKITI